MFGTDPEQVQRRLAQWSQQFADQADRFQAMREQVEQISVTTSSADGTVRVTVDSTGSPTDLALTEKIHAMAPSEVAAQVMACIRRAQGQLAGRVAVAMDATVGAEGQIAEHVVASFRARFGEIQEEDPRPDPGVAEWGTIEEDDPPPRPVRPQRPRPAGTDDDDFGDQSYLR